jgi:serine/threonine-protein kinase
LLRSETRAGRLVPVPIAVELLAQAAQGLDDAHEAVTPTGQRLEIVHRDVSPQNILVGVDGRARVTDFGIARAMMRRTATATGQVKGKFAYFSPEQASAKPVDRRTDVFALGIVAWETLTGRRLFDADNPIESIEKVKSMPIAPPHTLRTDVPPSVSRVVLAALERNLEARLQTAAEVADGLRHAAREAGLERPSARAIGRYVQDAGGEQLARIQRRIDAAMSGELPSEPSVPGRPSRLGSGSDVDVVGLALARESEAKSGVSPVSSHRASPEADESPRLVGVPKAPLPDPIDADDLPTRAREAAALPSSAAPSTSTVVHGGGQAPVFAREPFTARRPSRGLLAVGAAALVGIGIGVAAIVRRGAEDSSGGSATASPERKSGSEEVRSATPSTRAVPEVPSPLAPEAAEPADDRAAGAASPFAASGASPPETGSAIRAGQRAAPRRGARETTGGVGRPAETAADDDRGAHVPATAGIAGADGGSSVGGSSGGRSTAAGAVTSDDAETRARPGDRIPRGGTTGAASGGGGGSTGTGGRGTPRISRTGLLEEL